VRSILGSSLTTLVPQIRQPVGAARFDWGGLGHDSASRITVVESASAQARPRRGHTRHSLRSRLPSSPLLFRPRADA
jgi:hypothetical protein